jgi:hypothetical protein
MPIIGSFGAGSGKGFGLGAETGPAFIIATGGTITESGDYKIHTFTSDGTFTVTNKGKPTGSNTVDYLVVAGGGGGGQRKWRRAVVLAVIEQNYPTCNSGLLHFKVSFSYYSRWWWSWSYMFNSAQELQVQIQFFQLSHQPVVEVVDLVLLVSGFSGGSGGGGGNSNGTGGAGNTPPVSPPQGNHGGNATGNLLQHLPGGVEEQVAAGGNTPGPTGGGQADMCTANFNYRSSPVTRASAGGGGGSRFMEVQAAVVWRQVPWC